ncbi:MAG: hypothetical protein LBB47_08260 [Spirochaetaceae bacterium]|jgi:hypothetical protein|nr:hypothetical protein [Spirochaetaceae bacterium]
MKLTELAYNLKWFFSGITDKPLGTLKKHLAQKKIRVILICSAALIVAVPLVIDATAKILALIEDSKKNTVKNVFSFDPIAAEDFFIPDEPDFLPPVILERERKEVWSVEDASEFWTAPSEFSGEFWRDRVSDSIDQLLEPLP